MKYLVLALASILAFSSALLAQSNNPDNKCRNLSKETAPLVSEYRNLREKRRKLGQGNFDKDLDYDGGRLSRVLSSLGREFGRPAYTKEIVINCLGAPDAIRNHKKMRQFLGVYERELRKEGRKIEKRSDREYLIYFWRGWHDFLFFIVEDDAVVDHGWWFAYE